MNSVDVNHTPPAPSQEGNDLSSVILNEVKDLYAPT